mmetsp:Transcript_21960/g.61073  ORF Transcript_21960/g.61073 Transcript_21960/m.61073 type:complete len:207 (-) Transcript_21960:135-755(-)
MSELDNVSIAVAYRSNVGSTVEILGMLMNMESRMRDPSPELETKSIIESEDEDSSILRCNEDDFPAPACRFTFLNTDDVVLAISFLESLSPCPVSETCNALDISMTDAMPRPDDFEKGAESVALVEANCKVYKQERISPPDETTSWFSRALPDETESFSSARTARSLVVNLVAFGGDTENWTQHERSGLSAGTYLLLQMNMIGRRK